MEAPSWIPYCNILHSRRTVSYAAVMLGLGFSIAAAFDFASVAESTEREPRFEDYFSGQLDGLNDTSAKLDAFVASVAKHRASKAYSAPAKIKNDKNAKTYDDYRKMVFNRDRGRWSGEPNGFEVHALPMGWLFDHGISVASVDAQGMKPMQFTGKDFLLNGKELESQDPGKPKTNETPPEEVPISGFRINGHLNDPDKSDEIIVFQGASYFRALAKGQTYGLSGRGLAIATGSSKGEEFPEFQSFWIEKPAADAKSFVIHALLDSPSTTGAYRFDVTPGDETVVNVSAKLFPRKQIQQYGLAPLTSMNVLSPLTPGRIRDFRPRVHDSQALAIWGANGERIWRPLANPRALQISSFMGNAPKGFGLIQRVRKFDSYEDLEARYERRPSVWIEPKSDLFKDGEVVLVEIPAEQEWHDNIVAYWQPKEPLLPGKSYDFAYSMHWAADTPPGEDDEGLRVWATRLGAAHNGKDDALRFVIDYQGSKAGDVEKLPEGVVRASKGEVGDVAVQRNPETGGVRASFVFNPQGAESTELRLDLKGERPFENETWLYRWTRSD